MTRKRNLLATALAQFALLICASSVALAATMPKHERAAYARAIAAYTRTLASTKTGQVVVQMRAAERRIDPCLGQLRKIYRRRGPTSTAIDWLLGAGVHDTAEQWYAKAALPVDQVTQQRAYIDEIKEITSIDVCGVIAKWRAKHYAQAKRPLIIDLLMEYIGPSPASTLGAGHWVRTYSDWGYPWRTARQLAAELNRGLGLYSVLNATAYTQYIGWLQQVGIYKLMHTSDRNTIAFNRY